MPEISTMQMAQVKDQVQNDQHIKHSMHSSSVVLCSAGQRVVNLTSQYKQETPQARGL